MRSDVPINPKADITRRCRDCSQPFVLNVGEQEFFRDRNLSLPWRCKDCRAARKAAVTEEYRERRW